MKISKDFLNTGSIIKTIRVMCNCSLVVPHNRRIQVVEQISSFKL